MGLEETEFFHDLEKIIENKANKLLEKKYKQIREFFTEIGKKYNINDDEVQEILNLNCEKIQVNLKSKLAKQQRRNKVIQPEERCLAYINKERQCSRSRIKKSKFCKSHTRNRKFGRVDQPNEMLDVDICKNNKNNDEVDLDKINLDNYVQSIIIEIDGMKYLQDENGIIFSYDEYNIIVGYVNDEEELIWI